MILFFNYGINIPAFTLTSERLWHNLTKRYLDQSSATRRQEGALLQPTNASDTLIGFFVSSLNLDKPPPQFRLMVEWMDISNSTLVMPTKTTSKAAPPPPTKVLYHHLNYNILYKHHQQKYICSHQPTTRAPLVHSFIFQSQRNRLEHSIDSLYKKTSIDIITQFP